MCLPYRESFGTRSNCIRLKITAISYRNQVTNGELAHCSYPHLYSSKSAGWQSKALHKDSSVLNRIALAFPVFKFDKLARVISTFSESWLSDIFRLAIITSKFTTIPIVIPLIRVLPEFPYPVYKCRRSQIRSPT